MTPSSAITEHFAPIARHRFRFPFPVRRSAARLAERLPVPDVAYLYGTHTKNIYKWRAQKRRGDLQPMHNQAHLRRLN